MIAKSFKYAFWNTFDKILSTFILNIGWFFLHFFLIAVYFFKEQLALEVNSDWAKINPFEYLDKSSFLTIETNQGILRLLGPLHGMILFNVILWFSPFTVGVMHFARELSLKNNPGFKQYFKGTFSTFFKSLLLLALNATIVIVSFYNITFYESIIASKLLFYIIAIIVLIILTLYLFGTTYLLPIVVTEKISILAAIKKSFNAAFKTPRTIALSMILVALYVFFSKYRVIPFMTIVPFMFFYPVFQAQLVYEGYISATDTENKHRTYEENRTIKDFIFPWKSRGM